MNGVRSPALTLEAALRVAAAAMEAAASANRHVAVAVVDDGGHDLVIQRDHVAYLSAIPIARAKAFTAINFRQPTHEMAERLGSIDYAVQVSQADPRLAFVKGGLPIVVDDVVIGAVGVSGATADEDLHFAREGLAQL